MSRLVVLSMLLLYNLATAAPPFLGTVFIDADIVVPEDPSSFENLVYKGTGMRLMFDRRANAFITYNAYLFEAKFTDGLSAEIQVNPEFATVSAAQAEALKYGKAIGQLPTLLRVNVETVWIHKGMQDFGGGNNNILVHTKQGEEFINSGFLEEVLIHEGAHTSLDLSHKDTPGWRNAQITDNKYISEYARDNSSREDIAESFLTYIAARYRSDRISTQLKQTIENTIPDRLSYFDDQNFELNSWFVIPALPPSVHVNIVPIISILLIDE